MTRRVVLRLCAYIHMCLLYPPHITRRSHGRDTVQASKVVLLCRQCRPHCAAMGLQVCRIPGNKHSRRCKPCVPPAHFSDKGYPSVLCPLHSHEPADRIRRLDPQTITQAADAAFSFVLKKCSLPSVLTAYVKKHAPPIPLNTDEGMWGLHSCFENVLHDCGNVIKKVDQALIKGKLMLHPFQAIDGR